jgi:hypothetical protein
MESIWIYSRVTKKTRITALSKPAVRQASVMALLLLAAVAAAVVVRAAAAADLPACAAPDNAAGCGCGWKKDETGDMSFIGLQSPSALTMITPALTGLTAAELKAADDSPAACEAVCCKAKAIHDGVKTGPCGVWQWFTKAPPANEGCWLGVDPATRSPPYGSNPRPGERWVGAQGNLGPQSEWGFVLLLTAAIASVGYLGGGTLYNVRVHGKAANAEALPHPEFWNQLSGLVLDGVRLHFVRC